MAEHGRQSERLRRVEALIGVDANRLGTIEEGAASAQRDVLTAQQDVAALKAELAAARVTIALRDDKAAEHEREINTARIGNDSLRVELVALRTKLSAAEDGASLHQRELHQTLQAVTEKDDRLAIQAIDLMRRETAIAALEVRAASLQHEFQAMTDKRQIAEVERSDLESRLATLAADMRRKDAALAERDARLAIASGREAELVAEVTRLRRGNDPGAADVEINTLKLERARLQAELAALREDAHESWLRIEADNRMLRREMAQVAAEIAREIASRQAVGVAPVPERVAANDQDNAAKDGTVSSERN
jgi:chromosome segregation ATPase